ncbi:MULTISPECIES: hypothetical protein [Asaia]|uniref:Uncharacterized protein n=1 Tax=Asaia bogorensis TaxID=91915 RepID=A0A060QDE2_9PROT|nr:MULTISPECIES: hypothetical protein [Asaia]ETC97938.1 hypothetical protein P792_12300 [Asaia sp. SF2.1]CDG39144.1 hypothetical protein ASAP_1099 [Asaia bogorensis]
MDDEAILTDQTDSATGKARPEDRIEQALDRIAYALHHPQANAPEPMDWQPLAANIEALRLRVRDMIEYLADEEAV